MECDIAVIGAGLAGLTAAVKLTEAGYRVRVLEAADQVGGRLRSVVDETTRAYVADLGPIGVWPEFQPTAARWIARLRLATAAQYDAGAAIVELGSGRVARQRMD